MSAHECDLVVTLSDADRSESYAWSVGDGLLALINGQGRVYATSAGGDPRAARVTLRVPSGVVTRTPLDYLDEDPDVASYTVREVCS